MAPHTAHAARADPWERVGDHAEALRAWDRAAALATNPAEIHYVKARAEAIASAGNERTSQPGT
ncbi:hypothetical protein [Demequina sediminicola]|uniref:hypothetical protein n=1 Tax=Demequina sediminicola TaxID=1095026 RepID=UPI0007806CD7|nr:hypothetical protein [Demequina sediminicola]